MNDILKNRNSFIQESLKKWVWSKKSFVFYANSTKYELVLGAFIKNNVNKIYYKLVLFNGQNNYFTFNIRFSYYDTQYNLYILKKSIYQFLNKIIKNPKISDFISKRCVFSEKELLEFLEITKDLYHDEKYLKDKYSINEITESELFLDIYGFGNTISIFNMNSELCTVYLTENPYFVVNGYNYSIYSNAKKDLITKVVDLLVMYENMFCKDTILNILPEDIISITEKIVYLKNKST